MGAVAKLLVAASLCFSTLTAWSQQPAGEQSLTPSQRALSDELERAQSQAFDELKDLMRPGEVPDRALVAEKTRQFWEVVGRVEGSDLPQSSKDIFLKTMVDSYSTLMIKYLGFLPDILPDRVGQNGFETAVRWVGRFAMSMARDLLDFRAINTPVYRGQLVGIDRAAAMSLSAFEDVIEGQIEAKLSDGQATGEFLHLQRLIQKLEEMEPVRFQNRHKFMKKAYVGLAISHLLGFGYFVVGVPDVVGTFEIVFGLGDSPSYLSPLYSNGLWALFFVTLNRMRHNNSGSRVRNAYNRLKSIVHKVVAAEEGQVWPAQRLDGHPGLGTLDAANLCSMAVRNDPTKDIDPPATDRVLF